MQRMHDEQIIQSLPECFSQPDMPAFSELERLVFELVCESPIHFDQIAEQSQLQTNALSSALTFLELRGLIKAQAGNKFTRATSLSIKNTDGSERKNH